MYSYWPGAGTQGLGKGSGTFQGMTADGYQSAVFRPIRRDISMAATDADSIYLPSFFFF